jgi:site-specific DNA recombinase
MERQVRAALYGRVSDEEQVEGYSLDAQRRAFQALVQGRGWTAYREYMEEGKSAYTDDIRKRPRFKEAIDDGLAGKYDILVVHKIDRFSRKLRITLEYFEKLGKAGIGFVSIQNEIDYSTPTGKFMLVMQGGLAELYSDNLSEETKKGMAERKAQGLYCGSLPFGVMKGDHGVPVPSPDTYPGLIMAFELVAEGNPDREVALALNTKGYRTAGSRGNRPFSTSSVRWILRNRFYLGYLPDGKGGWVKGKHEPFIDPVLWEQAQVVRKRNRTCTHTSCTRSGRLWSLTGLTYCWYCQGWVHTQYVYQGQPRLGCYNRQKGWGCQQKSASLSVYESQILAYLSTFLLPEDHQDKIMEAHRKLEAAYSDNEWERAKLESQLKRVKELYERGDYTKADYQARRDNILKQLAALTPSTKGTEHLERLAKFLADVPAAWEAATPEQRNKLARCLFDQVWVQDKRVVAVKPRAELEPFFRLNYEEFLKENIEGQRSRRVQLHLNTYLRGLPSAMDLIAVKLLVLETALSRGSGISDSTIRQTVSVG